MTVMSDLTLNYRLQHILDAVDRIERNMAGVTFETYRDNGDLQWLIERGVLIVSEAVRHIPVEQTVTHPAVPWQPIKAIVNKLRHEYQWVDPYIMWTIATQHLRDLRPVIAEMQVALNADTPPSPDAA
jgi:uncharacterized protein with HEPN domain